MADTNYQDLKDSIDSLTKAVTEGFATIHSDIRELESSLTYNQDEFNRLSEKDVKTTEQHEKAMATHRTT